MVESQSRNVCSTCGGSVSKMVKHCPHCNTRQAGKGQGGIAVVAIIFTLIIMVPVVFTCVMVMQNYEKIKEYLLDSLSQSVEAGSAVDSEGVSIKLKAFLDSYEACVDELCEAMPSALNGEGGPDTKVPALTEKYEELSTRAAKIQQAELSSADQAYYLATMARIQDKLRQAGITGNADTTVSSNVSSERSSSSGLTVNGIRPEVKEVIDACGAVFDAYTEFMKNYDASDATKLSEYTDFMGKYTEAVTKMEKLEEDYELTNEEALYYSEVMLKASSNMLGAIGTLKN